jgi:hypothetical protein
MDHPSSLLLLPALDEWTMAYSGNSFFKPMLVIDGQISGTWTAALEKNTVTIDVTTPVKVNGALQGALQRQTERYSGFLERRDVVLTLD